MTEWIWVDTKSGLSCLNVGSVIGISEGDLREGSFLDFHMTSGTIFTVELSNASKLLDALGVVAEV